MTSVRACVACAIEPAGVGCGLCAHCSASRIDIEGRQESDLGVVAAVSERGRGHERNEDAFFLSVGSGAQVAAVVCDGVGSSSGAAEAAVAAAQAAGRVLARAIRDGSSSSEAMTIEAIARAREAVALVVPENPNGVAPSCTLVSVACAGGSVTVGWVGDSRAYWLGDEESRLLTEDDTPDAGARPRNGRRASSRINRWIGADAPSEPPRLTTFRPHRFGRIVLCSDGLWSALSGGGSATSMRGSTSSSATPLTTARRLSGLALAQGGHDDVTVAVCDTGPTVRST